VVVLAQAVGSKLLLDTSYVSLTPIQQVGCRIQQQLKFTWLRAIVVNTALVNNKRQAWEVFAWPERAQKSILK
jgi:hypothetical protein